MKNKILLTIVCFLGLTLSAGSAGALVLDYANVDGATINFVGTGDTFSFPNTGTYDFVITSATGSGDGDTVGLQGNIGGSFTIGAITISGPLQTAGVSGSGTFSIVDEASTTFSGTLTWIDIYTLGTAGALNSGGTANLTNISYSGSNTDLLAFVTPGGINTLTFQFIPAKSLTDLTTDGANNSTSYSGSLTPVPVPPTALLLGSGLLGLGLLGWRRRRG